MKIQNKIGLVTGATSGIGLAIARKLIGRGVSAIGLVDISNQCEAVAEELNEELNSGSGGLKVYPFCGDVTDLTFRSQVFETMERQFGVVQICVPAAGILKDGLAVKQHRETGEISLYPEADFKKVIDINLTHPTYWAMETIAGIAKNRQQAGLSRWQTEEGVQGVTILIGSVSSRGNRGQVSYAGAKSALIGVCKTLNVEGLFYGVQTKIIHPGFVDTPMVESIDNDYFEKNLKPLIGLGRKIHPDEIAEIVCTMIENPVISGEVWADASLAPLA